MTEHTLQLTLGEHFSSLRSTLIRCLLLIAVGFFVSFFFYEHLFQFLTQPLQSLNQLETRQGILQRQIITRERIRNMSPNLASYHLSVNSIFQSSSSSGISEIQPGIFTIPPGEYLDIETSSPKKHLVSLHPLEGFIVTAKICFFVGLVATSPLWLFLVLQFIAPALHSQEKRLLFPFLLLSLILVSTGFLFSFSLTIPFANKLLYGFNTELSLNFWSLSSYLDYTLFLLLANSFAFELFAILLFLVHFGVFSAEQLSAKRRHFIVLAFILGALLTPPDVFTQFLLAIPLILLYEFSILYARIKKPAP